jgi:sugar phosphate isomerase/epimerase
MKVGIDNYGLTPLDMSPLEVLAWARENGAAGVQFSGLSGQEREPVDHMYLKEMAAFVSDNRLYLEWGGGQHIPLDMSTWEPKDIFGINRSAAAEASVLGARIIRSCSGGLMRWDKTSPPTSEFLERMAEALRAQRKMLEDHNVILALETHFEFTTFELLQLFKMCEAEPGDYLGICLDTMNLLTMLEDPLSATRRVLPWVVSTHIKDGGILLHPEGLQTFTAEVGKGIVDIPSIVRLLDSLPHEVNLSIEDHGGEFVLPIFDSEFLAEFPDLTLLELTRLLVLAQKCGSAVNAGTLSPLAREAWPAVCEKRLKQDLQVLSALVEKTLPEQD